jgi:hypothetical protein
VDLAALERGSKLRVETWDLGNQFVPFYRVVWAISDRPPERVAARVELFEPKRLLIRLSVEKPELIRREPLLVPNRDALLEAHSSVRSSSSHRANENQPPMGGSKPATLR